MQYQRPYQVDLTAHPALRRPPILVFVLADLWSFTKAAVRAMLRAVARRRQQHKAYAQLQSMSDYQLKDIGFHRSELVSVVYGPAPDPSRRRRGAR